MSTRPHGACKVVAKLNTRSFWLRRNIDDGNVITPQNDPEGESRIVRSGIPRKYLKEKFLLIGSRRKKVPIFCAHILRVETATTLGDWSVLRDNIPGTGGYILFIDDRVLSGVNAVFYRVAVY